ncbi:hypothetical protein A6A40_00120 [Azospirillum humicireducens]|uniref:Uncharacterized protein n=1 Tax=Azospirillum humicireducens TaxID=1226968 RepID=A0A160JCR8_9PROT|nr:hypothetical protein [Azospirillum humicireducens]ANC90448.1 hypothetical protein A6A40_00120 [Azospirillum humicireducens]
MKRPGNGRFTGCVAACAIAALLAGGAALALPSGYARAAETVPAEQSPEAAIRTRIEAMLPAPWRIESLMVEPLSKASAQTPEPQATARVTAKLVLGAPTYLVDSREGPVTFLRPAADAGLAKTWIATALATRGPDGWTVTLTPQTPDLLDGIGKPAAELPGRTVVLGTAEARSLREQLDRDAVQRLADDTERRRREEERLAQQTAAAKAEAARAETERRAVEARIAQLADLRGKLAGNDRAARLAAFEAALGGNDPALRQTAMEAALQSRDPVVANLALKDWIARRRAVPVQLYATKEDPSSEVVVQNLGPMTLEIDGFSPVNGALAGKLGAPGYSIARPSSIVGALAQTELAVNSFGCALTLRLTEHRTLDGLLRCQTLPTLIARITLD